MHCLSSSETMASSYVDAKNRQQVSDGLTAEKRAGIHICYGLIGFIPLSELMEQEMA